MSDSTYAGGLEALGLLLWRHGFASRGEEKDDLYVVIFLTQTHTHSEKGVLFGWLVVMVNVRDVVMVNDEILHSSVCKK